MPREITLVSTGRAVTVNDLSAYDLAATDIPLPNQAMHDVLTLVTGAGLALSQAQQNENDRAYIRGVYELCALWLEKPKLVLRGPAINGSITPGQLSWGEATELWGLFRRGDTQTATPNEPGQGEGTALPSADVSLPAE